MGQSETPEWARLNRAHWDSTVPVHVASEFYDLAPLRAGEGRLYPVEEAELPRIAPNGWAGLRVLHLQCHFGADTLVLAQRGAEVVGLDFSMPAVKQARALATELGLDDRSRFVCADLYDARHALPEPEGFDVVYTTWGTIGWLPDIVEWARIVSWFLKPGGRFYFADGHPSAFVFDDPQPGAPTALLDGGPAAFPTPRFSYFEARPLDLDEAGDYADPDAELEHSRTVEWMHPLGQTLTALVDAGLALDFVHEHDAVPWQMFSVLEPRGDGLWAWPGTAWLPLGMSLGATRRAE
ncbi:class I SAM-dependent methyltransferase [Microcella humidisoli]|uniref:Class I SAM-dependent methyltransferase n=1 Tax=Microcella humidisoli TaxID=2963406 RepID=A0ABY5FVF3_9MICO|nr:class I SAM-dependent methyltransferase [Microcella humidisoli]UTT61761.1 class I SAM-dependent methyltransferase [Microcella humidisoli]